MKVIQVIIAKRALFPEVQELILKSGCEVEKNDLQQNTWELTLAGMADSIEELDRKIKDKWQPKEVFTVIIPVYRLYFTVADPEKIPSICTKGQEAGLKTVTPNGGSENGTKFFFQGGESQLMSLQNSLGQAGLPQGCLM
ncbi:hypothetical protein ACFL2U_00610 [Patescibacteria group bacterium]